jgi:hypothetical protein
MRSMMSLHDWMRFHYYMNNGKDRQTDYDDSIQRCEYDYEQKRYELFGNPSGVDAITENQGGRPDNE